MKIDIRTLLAPLLAALVLVLVVQRTLGALKSSGSWQARPPAARVAPADPYARLDRLLAERADSLDPRGLRNPLHYEVQRAPVARRVTPPRRPARVPAQPKPVLTAIIWDNDPRATIRFEGRDFSVRQNSRFADFRVRSITSAQVVLERNGEPLVLTLRPKGE